MSNVEAGKEPDERTYPATVAEISSPGMIFINRGALHGVLDHGEAAVRRRVRKKSSFQVFSGAGRKPRKRLHHPDTSRWRIGRSRSNDRRLPEADSARQHKERAWREMRHACFRSSRMRPGPSSNRS